MDKPTMKVVKPETLIRKRTTISLYVSQKEKAAIKKLAKAKDVSLNRYIKGVLLG